MTCLQNACKKFKNLIFYGKSKDFIEKTIRKISIYHHMDISQYRIRVEFKQDLNGACVSPE